MSKQSTVRELLRITWVLQSESVLKWLKKPVYIILDEVESHWGQGKGSLDMFQSNLKVWGPHMLNKEFNCLWYTIQIALRKYSITQHITKSCTVHPS